MRKSLLRQAIEDLFIEYEQARKDRDRAAQKMRRHDRILRALKAADKEPRP